jgi:hypothetical protein
MYRKFAFQTICHSKNLDIFSLIGPKRSPLSTLRGIPSSQLGGTYLCGLPHCASKSLHVVALFSCIWRPLQRRVARTWPCSICSEVCHRPCQSILLIGGDSLRLPRASEFGDAVVRGPSERISEEVQLWKKSRSAYVVMICNTHFAVPCYIVGICTTVPTRFRGRSRITLSSKVHVKNRGNSDRLSRSFQRRLQNGMPRPGQKNSRDSYEVVSTQPLICAGLCFRKPDMLA